MGVASGFVSREAHIAHVDRFVYNYIIMIILIYSR
jgi:hypothetical protein